MNRFKEHKGITLIALVITIIVLLILAGVAINSIMGQDSTPEKAVEAGKKNDQGAELDQIKIAVVGAVANGNTGLVDAESLKNELNGIVEDEGRLAIRSDNAPWVVVGKTGKVYEIKRNTQVELVKGVAFSKEKVEIAQDKTIEITVTNITGQTLNLTTIPTNTRGITVAKGEENKITITTTDEAVIGTKVTVTGTAGTESDIFEIEVIDDKVGTINSKIGNTVQYSVIYSDGDSTDSTIDKWQVFYADADNNRVFIISQYILEWNRIPIGDTETTSGAYPAGAAEESLASSTYGGKYNSQWLSLEGAGLTDTTVNNSAKSVAYLCDSTNSNWIKYARGTFGTGTQTTVASTNVYAVGGPTIELLQKSVREYDSTLLNGDFSINNNGYEGGFNMLPNGLYCTMYKDWNRYGSWWIASPARWDNYSLRYVYGNGTVQSIAYNAIYNSIGVRPLVSIPLDEFQTNWINSN